MTNREVLIFSLQNHDADECTVDYIACPYVSNPDCKYGEVAGACTDCKMIWLEKEWEE